MIPKLDFKKSWHLNIFNHLVYTCWLSSESEENWLIITESKTKKQTTTAIKIVHLITDSTSILNTLSWHSPCKCHNFETAISRENIGSQMMSLCEVVGFLYLIMSQNWKLLSCFCTNYFFNLCYKTDSRDHFAEIRITSNPIRLGSQRGKWEWTIYVPYITVLVHVLPLLL